jgi:hypothetical protein
MTTYQIENWGQSTSTANPIVQIMWTNNNHPLSNTNNLNDWNELVKKQSPKPSSKQFHCRSPITNKTHPLSQPPSNILFMSICPSTQPRNPHQSTSLRQRNLSSRKKNGSKLITERLEAIFHRVLSLSVFFTSKKHNQKISASSLNQPLQTPKTPNNDYLHKRSCNGTNPQKTRQNF